MMNQTDKVLVERAQAGDKAAFSQLVMRYWGRVQRVLQITAPTPSRGQAVSSSEVDDLLQEAFLQAWLSLDRLRDADKFRSWVCGIGLNLARMRLRSLPNGYQLREVVAVSDPRPTPEQQAERRQTAARLQEAIADLPPSERDALLLVYFGGLSHRETAVKLGASISAVKVRVHRGRRRLRDKLQPEFGVLRKRPVRPKMEAMMIKVSIDDVLAKRSAIDVSSFVKPMLTALPEQLRESFAEGVSISVSSLQAGNVWETLQTMTEEEGEAIKKAIEPFMLPHIVLLRDKKEDRLLPIWIGPFEAEAIAIKLRDHDMKRPITHDLMTTLLSEGGLNVQQVAISRIHERVFYGSLRVAIGSNGETIEIDCRPSDALSLAVRLDVPIFVDKEVMVETAVSVADFSRDDHGQYVLKDEKYKGQQWYSLLA